MGAYKTTREETTLQDDLKQIHGIGAGVEKRLNDAGILTFGQLGDAAPGEIAAALKGMVGYTLERIRTQDWIGQARRLEQEMRQRDALSDDAPVDDETLGSEIGGNGDFSSGSAPYAVFTIQFLLDEYNRVRRTHVLNVQTQQDDTWAGWEWGKLTEFFANSARLKLEASPPAAIGQGSAVSPREKHHSHIPANHAGGNPYRGSITVNDWRILEGDRLLKRLILTNQPFDLAVDVDLSQTQFSPEEPLSCEVQVYAHPANGGERIAIGRSEARMILGTIPGTQSAEPEAAAGPIRTVHAQGTLQEPGAYRLEVITIVRPSDPTAGQNQKAIGLLEGILVQTYDPS